MNFLIELEDFPCYFVGVDGVYSEKNGGMTKMKGSLVGKGYYGVCLQKDGKAYNRYIHRLIAQTFIPNPYNLPNIDHINRNKTDNRIQNLRWVTQSDNMRNGSIRSDNKSGYPGVHYDKNKDSWIARCYNNQKKPILKYFFVKEHGDNSKQLAIEHRKMMEDELYNRPEP